MTKKPRFVPEIKFPTCSLCGAKLILPGEARGIRLGGLPGKDFMVHQSVLAMCPTGHGKSIQITHTEADAIRLAWKADQPKPGPFKDSTPSMFPS